MGSRVQTILVVDDDSEIRALICRIMQAAGFRSLEASDGSDALKILKLSSPDLIIMDLNMPGMNGREVCEAIRRTAEDAFFPIVLMSGSDTTDQVVRGLASGANDFLGKPFQNEVLVAKVNSLLRTKKIFSDLTNFDSLESTRSREDVAVAFVDLRGFTAFSEAFDLDQVIEVIDEYHRELGLECRIWNGKMGGFSGDGVLIFFSYSETNVCCLETAIRFALKARTRLVQLTEQWHKKNYDLNFGIGIAKGEGQIGKIGFGQDRDYTVIGSVSNKAARLAAAAKGAQILVPLEAVEKFKNRIEKEKIGSIALKGFKNELDVCNIISLK